MSNIYFWSDLHLGDKNVAQHRGFDNVTDHDDFVLSAWADTVRPRDVVYFLGDLSIYNVTGALAEVSKLAGKKRIIYGNHDPAHPMHRNWASQQSRFMEVFENGDSFATVRVGRETVMLSHFPYEGDHADEDRHVAYRPRDTGMTLIHGHVHHLWRVRASQQRFAPMINVGVDVRPWPVHIDYLYKLTSH